jgi:hypothetical protein
MDDDALYTVGELVAQLHRSAQIFPKTKVTFGKNGTCVKSAAETGYTVMVISHPGI